ncbi:MAG: DUF5050 domain-containing protein [Lachnospiraceae bacterium]|nr:DUF5050 domain-containing protein [Lachnospiraceae bacterium]
MNKTAKRIIGIGIALLIIALLIIGHKIGELADRIPDNPPETVGNTAGNLYNGGTFCESEGVVYFSNPYDGGSIYAMDPDQSNMRKVVTAGASYINAGGNYLYYYSASSAGQSGLGYIRNGRGLYRVDKAGKRNILLKQTQVDGLSLLGNTIFYTAFADKEPRDPKALTTMNTIRTNAENDRTILNGQIKIGSGEYGELYYAGISGDHYLYAADSASGASRRICELNMYEPTLVDGRVFFLDMDDEMKLKVWSTYDNSVIQLSGERIESFNLYGDTIYYQTIDESGNNEYAFKRIHTDGSGEEVLLYGVVRDIQVTSTYVYFRDFNADMPIYQIPTGGSSISSFDAAINGVETP